MPIKHNKPNQNLTPSEAAIERSIAASHNLLATSGPHVGEGSGLQLRLGIISGAITTLLLGDEERRWFIDWLEATPVDNPLYTDILGQVARQLRAAMAREE